MANWRIFPNGGASTLSSAMNSSQTTAVMVDGSGFTNPASGQEYTAKIDGEYIRVTGVSSNTLTITRAQEGSTGAAHSVGAILFTCIAKSDFDTLRQQSDLLITSGVPSSPTFATPQQMAFDPATSKLYVWNGTAWKSVTLT